MVAQSMLRKHMEDVSSFQRQYLRFVTALHGFYIRWLLISGCVRMMLTRSFSENKIGFDDSFDVTKCLQQIEMLDLLHVCA